jgi:hypothetical protein
MSRKQSARRLVEAALAIRMAARDVSDPDARRRLALAEARLREELGWSVPKGVAASLLGVTPAGLERWIDAGRLPVVRRPGGREEVAVEALLDVADELAARPEGVVRAPLAEAFRRLDRGGLPRRRLRPNQTAAELRRSFTATTPTERLREAAELSHAATVLAARGARRRAR